MGAEVITADGVMEEMEPRKEYIRELNVLVMEIISSFIKYEEYLYRKGRRDNGLTVSEAHLIEKVGAEGGRSMGEIAALLGVSAGTLSVSVARLEKKGIIVRKRCEGDKRVALCSLTRRGRAALRMHERFHARMIKNVLSALDSDTAESFGRILTAINEFLSSETWLAKRKK